MKLAILARLFCVLLVWLAAPHLPAGFAADPETPDTRESESATLEATAEVMETEAPVGAAAFELPSSCCETCVGQSCSTCGGACSFFDPPCNACGVDPRIYRSLILGRLWVELEYLAWSSRSTRLPPLVTTGDATASPAEAGVLGSDNTSILFGNADYHGDLRSGGRLTGGYWFTPEHRFGIEGSFFQVDGGEAEFLALGDATPVLARPVINAQTGLPAAVLVSYPGVQLGGIAVMSEMDLLGAEALLRRAMRSGSNYRLDGVVGYRYQRLLDRLSVDESFDFAREDDSDETTSLDRFDDFASENEFHGGEVGLIGRWWGCRWAVQALGKVALGGTRTTTTIDGGTVRTVTNDDPAIEPIQTAYAGGVLALPSNRGRYSQSDFGAVGELGVRIEYAWNKQCRMSLGYTVMYWPSVARVTDSIDTVVDPSQIPPDANPSAASPSFVFRDTEFWTQGLNAGLHIDF
jgi:hypothetical protein